MKKSPNKPNAAARVTGPKGSAHIKQPSCPVAGECGACQLLSVPYEQQLASKQASVEELFAELIDANTAVLPILGMTEPYHYRNKVASPFAPARTRKPTRNKKARTTQGTKPAIAYGMYKAGTHELIPTAECLIENQIGQRVVQAVLGIMRRYNIEPYNEDTGQGFLRHVITRVGHTSGEVLVTLVTNAEQFTGARNFVRELVKRVPEITSVVQNINTRQTNVILGNREQRLYGPGFILDELCGLSFRISSHSFYQVNSTQTEVLYRRAIQLAQLSGTEHVLDAYCGTGTIGLVAARGLANAPGAHAAHVTGVDNVKAAITDALNNATHNGIDNAEFVCADATEFIRNWADGDERVDVLLMDPPRSGSTPEFMDAAIQLAPQRIVYISCNPVTQVRDLKPLLTHGYRIHALQAVDMFPHTNHVECVALMSRTDG